MLARTGLGLVALTTLALLPLATAHADTPTCAGLTPTIVGTSGNDDLTGTPGNDIVFLDAGNDRFDGKGGDDKICGGAGDDTLYGGAGNDWLYGDDGNDRLAGQVGDDKVVTGDGRNVVIEGVGDDTLRGGSGIDELNYRAASIYGTSGAMIDAVAGTASGYGSDTLRGFESYVLTGRSDTFYGRDAAERVSCWGGSDTIFTAGGNDRVRVGSGAHRIHTGTGDDRVDGYGNVATRISLGAGDDTGNLERADVISGGDGNDALEADNHGARLLGGGGSDTVTLSGNPYTGTGVAIDLTTQRAYSLSYFGNPWLLSSVENATGSRYNDVIDGTPGRNILWGLSGNDYIDGHGGNDLISGGPGDDVIRR